MTTVTHISFGLALKLLMKRRTNWVDWWIIKFIWNHFCPKSISFHPLGKAEMNNCGKPTMRKKNRKEMRTTMQRCSADWELQCWSILWNMRTQSNQKRSEKKIKTKTEITITVSSSSKISILLLWISLVHCCYCCKLTHAAHTRMRWTVRPSTHVFHSQRYIHNGLHIIAMILFPRAPSERFST